MASAADLLQRASTARAAGDVDAMRACLIEAFAAARRAGDGATMARVALELPSGQRFGIHAGQIPALVHEAYEAEGEPGMRARLAAALARAWVYDGDAGRAVPYAAEALELASAGSDPAVLADALDASLAARWGPDDFAERPRLAARLADAAAHLTDVEARLSAHLWRLTTAWECLDIVAVQRQLRALEVLAADSGSARVAYFAVSRRAMRALVAGDLGAARALIDRSHELGARTGEPDAFAVGHSLEGAFARLSGDIPALAREAAEFESYGEAEGIPSVLAESAVLWLAAGQPRRAADVAHTLADLSAVAHDVDFLLTICSVVHVAAATGLRDALAESVRLLEPYAGRAVLNAGAVVFHGVVDDYLFQALRALGDPAAQKWRHSAESAYRRLGAAWWLRQVGAPSRTTDSSALCLYRSGEVWTVGPAAAPVSLADLKGLHYLRFLLQRPGAEVSATVLSDAVAGHPGVTVSEVDSELVDRQALAAYRKRLRDIDVEIAQAGAWSDPGRLERLEDERDALLAEVRTATGLGGRIRHGSSAGERARVAVRKAIAAAVARIEAELPEVGRLLRDTVRTGQSCRYDPDPGRPVTWQLIRPGGRTA